MTSYFILLEEHSNTRGELFDGVFLLLHHVGEVETDRAHVNAPLGKV